MSTKETTRLMLAAGYMAALITERPGLLIGTMMGVATLMLADHVLAWVEDRFGIPSPTEQEDKSMREQVLDYLEDIHKRVIVLEAQVNAVSAEGEER